MAKAQKPVKPVQRLTPILLNDPEVAGPEGLNRQIDIAATTDGTTSKRLVLTAIKKYRPELSKLIDKELKVSR